MTFQQRFKQIDQIRFEYFEAGQGRPLLFFHGAGINAKAYFPSLEKLTTKFKIIAPNLPGYCQSTPPKNMWHFEQFGQLFTKFIDKLKIAQPVLMGHSFGGGVAMSGACSTLKNSAKKLLKSYKQFVQFPGNKIASPGDTLSTKL